MTNEQIIEAIRKATNGTFIGEDCCSTLMGWLRIYDDQGRLVTCDPNFKDSHINIDGTTYYLTVHKWEKIIWKPEIGNKGRYNLLLSSSRKENIDKFALYYVDNTPDYVKEYNLKQKQKRLEEYEQKLLEKEKSLEEREKAVKEFEDNKKSWEDSLERTKTELNSVTKDLNNVTNLFNEKKSEVVEYVMDHPRLVALCEANIIYDQIRNIRKCVLKTIEYEMDALYLSTEEKYVLKRVYENLKISFDEYGYLFSNHSFNELIKIIKMNKNFIINNEFSNSFRGSKIYERMLKFEGKLADTFEKGWLDALITGISIHNYISEDELNALKTYENSKRDRDGIDQVF